MEGKGPEFVQSSLMLGPDSSLGYSVLDLGNGILVIRSVKQVGDLNGDLLDHRRGGCWPVTS